MNSTAYVNSTVYMNSTVYVNSYFITASEYYHEQYQRLVNIVVNSKTASEQCHEQ